MSQKLQMKRIAVLILVLSSAAGLSGGLFLWMNGYCPEGPDPAAANPALRKAVFPAKRVIAYYGNFYSRQMGVLGQYPETEMLSRLKAAVREWNKADRKVPAIPALHYVAVAAQSSPGVDGKYRSRMPTHEIHKVLALAHKVHGLVFLDVQVGKSNEFVEIPRLDPFLRRPDVHLGIDPEFYMRGKSKPGKVIGTMSGADINWAIDHLSKIVIDYKLPPKILVIHRFTPGMVTHLGRIQPTPQVQVVMDMDGWGSPSFKQTTYRICISKESTEYAGFKIFYKNDLLQPKSRLMTPQEILNLKPRPLYIQYQ